MNNKTPFGLGVEEKRQLLAAMRRTSAPAAAPARQRQEGTPIAPHLTSFEALPGYKQLRVQQAVAQQAGLEPPYYQCHDDIAKAHTHMDGREYLNFATYDYLDLNGHPAIAAAAQEAMLRYGTSASASRLTAGERPPHRVLEGRLAGLYQAEDCIAYVSGHAANVSTLGCLFGPQDAIFHDALSHNSLVQGALLSGATRLAFANNDTHALEQLLLERRHQFQRAVIVTEGLFGMDGCVCPLPELVELKRRFGCFLMVDEAHSLGVLGATGRGVHEHYGVPGAAVDIWMGTLSKTLCGCGGFVAGSAALVEFLKFHAPGFVYSVGMPPLLAAASAMAVDLMLAEPQRVQRVQALSTFLLRAAKERGLDTGRAQGYAVAPVMVGDSLSAAFLAQELKIRGILAIPIIYPGVEEGQSRLRFFVSAAHNEADILLALDTTAACMPIAREKAAACAR